MWAYPGTAPIFWLPSINSRNRQISYGLEMWQVHSQDASELKSIKNFGEEGAWAYPGLPKFLGYPYYLRNG